MQSSGQYMNQIKVLFFLSIDRVLGVPQHTIAEKLAMDPMMSSVYSLGNQNHFNNMFNNTEEKFTYIVPANLAWDEVNQQYTSGYKILFMGAFAYQVSFQ